MIRMPIAHQGAWDEVLLFALPVIVALAAVRLVERRITAKAIREAEPPESDDPTDVEPP